MTIEAISKELDTIYVDEKEYKTIVLWHKMNDIHVADLVDKAFFPFKNFVIRLSVKGMVMNALVELDDFNYMMGGKITTNNYCFTYKRGKNNDGWEMKGEGATPYSEQALKEQFELIHHMVIAIMDYICFCARKRITKVSPEIIRKERENYEYKPRECFLLNDIVKYVSIHPNKKSIQYRCEVWGVRGHIRHYQDGKVVFIKPYKKGKKRDILEPKSKVYLVEPG